MGSMNRVRESAHEAVPHTVAPSCKVPPSFDSSDRWRIFFLPKTFPKCGGKIPRKCEKKWPVRSPNRKEPAEVRTSANGFVGGSPVSLKYFYGALFQDVFPFGFLFAFCTPFVEVSEICDLCFNLLGSGRSLDAMELLSKLTISLLSSRSRGKFHSKRTPFPVVRVQYGSR